MNYQVTHSFETQERTYSIIKVGDNYYSTDIVDNSVIFTNLSDGKEHVIVSEGGVQFDNYGIIAIDNIVVFTFRTHLYIIDKDFRILHSFRYPYEQRLKIIDGYIYILGSLNIRIKKDGSYEKSSNSGIVDLLRNPSIVVTHEKLYGIDGFIILPDIPKRITHVHRQGDILLVVGNNGSETVSNIYNLPERRLLETKVIERGSYIGSKLLSSNTITDLLTGQQKYIYNAKKIVPLGDELAVIYDEGVMVIRDQAIPITDNFHDMCIITQE